MFNLGGYKSEIAMQIENEYNNVQLAYREAGVKYIKWAADMAVGLYSDIPWIMCKQKKAPANVVSHPPHQ